MIAWELLDRTPTPDGPELALYRRGDEFSLRIEAREVMNSRQHHSEDALAQLACAGLHARTGARVLVGGLGMGFTLAAALERLPADAEAVVAEIVPAVVAWNRGPLGDAAGRPLEDPRTRVREGDVADAIRERADAFDAVMLDVDNSPDSLIQRGNDWLYGADGLAAIARALRAGGALTVWSVSPDRGFTRRLRAADFRVKEHAVRARPGRGARHHVWVARRGRQSMYCA